jgi:DNA-binding Xre family transcriptional regulator
MIEISPESILKHAKLSGMSLNNVYQITGSNVHEIVRRGRTSAPVIRKIASALRCKPEDLIVGELPEEDEETAGSIFGPTCYETKSCFGRSDDGHCKILAVGYANGKRCPFCKERRDA